MPRRLAESPPAPRGDDDDLLAERLDHSEQAGPGGVLARRSNQIEKPIAQEKPQTKPQKKTRSTRPLVSSPCGARFPTASSSSSARRPRAGARSRSLAARSPPSSSSPRASTHRSCSLSRPGAPQPRQLPPARVGASGRGVGRREPGAHLRPPLDVRLERARRGRDDLRASPNHGDERADD